VVSSESPFHAIEDFESQIVNLLVAKVLPAGQYPAQQDGRIDGGDLRIPDALTGVLVREVEEKASMIRHGLPEKSQRGHRSIFCVRIRNVAALLSDTKRSQPKAGRGDAGHNPFVRLPYVAAIFDQAGLRIALLPEVLEVRFLQVFQELVVLGR
jgi:hypothetical protein